MPKVRCTKSTLAATRAEAKKAFTEFWKIYADKYPKAWEFLEKDREQLLNFYNSPAAHWVHLRTTNAIESTTGPLSKHCLNPKGTAVGLGQFLP